MTIVHPRHRPEKIELWWQGGAGVVRRVMPPCLGNLVVLEEIGRGGMGVVYRAIQRLANREVAVKVLSDSSAIRGESARRFSGEVETLARLRHPNIVEVYEVGEDTGYVFYSMELVPGGSLAARVKLKPLTPAEAAAIVEQLADAAHAAHLVGVIHRDIKPANVLLAADGRPKLSDFGLAKWIDREDGLTETGAVLGTPSYMAPEQAAGSKQAVLGPRTDVYGLGATLYELLTGNPPFRGANPYETVQRVLNEPPVPPRTVCPDTHKDLEAVCLKCLEKDPAQRYSTAQALSEDLRRWRAGESTVARPLSWRQRAGRVVRRRVKWVAAVGVFVAAVVIGAILLTEPRHDRKIMRSLARGEAVTLIGETGAPQYHRWIVGSGTANNPRKGELFLLFTAGNGLVELVPDGQTDRYRLSAEFRVDASTHSDSWAGVYFSHQAHALGPDVAADRAIIVRFSDDLMTNRPNFSDKGQPNVFDFVNVADSLHYPLADGGLKLAMTSLGSLRVEESKPRIRPWRQIVATVTPDQIAVQWREPDGSYRPVAAAGRQAIPASTLERTTGSHRVDLQQNRPGLDASRLVPYQARGGVGLYLCNARVFFRNVVLEPLPRQSAP